MKRQCVCCSAVIAKSGVSDPYVCRDCERKGVQRWGRYGRIDRKAGLA